MDNYNQSSYGNEQTGHVGFGGNHVEENIVVSRFAKNSLLSISQWVKFLTIVGFVGVAILIILGILFIGVGGTLFSEFDGYEDIGGLGAVAGGFVGFLYIIIAAIYMYPLIKMLNYANKMKRAVLSNSQGDYEEALRNFKSGVKFVGILTIIALAIYAIAIVGAIVAGALS